MSQNLPQNHPRPIAGTTEIRPPAEISACRKLAEKQTKKCPKNLQKNARQSGSAKIDKKMSEKSAKTCRKNNTKTTPLNLPPRPKTSLPANSRHAEK